MLNLGGAAAARAAAGAGGATAVGAEDDLPSNKIGGPVVATVSLTLGSDVVGDLLRREMERVTAAQLALQRRETTFEEMKVWRGSLDCGEQCPASCAVACFSSAH
jgi:hypothetical protein